MEARLRPKRSPILLPIRMNAADTSASSAIADCTPLTVVSRSSTTEEIDTFISDVSTTRTNIAIASSRPRRPGADACSGTEGVAASLTLSPDSRLARGRASSGPGDGGPQRRGWDSNPRDRGYRPNGFRDLRAACRTPLRRWTLRRRWGAVGPAAGPACD